MQPEVREKLWDFICFLYLRCFFVKQLHPMFSIEKTLLNESHFRARVCLSLIVKYWSLNLELADVKIWQIFEIFWGRQISKYFTFCLYWPIQCSSYFFKRMRSYIVKGFYLSSIKKVRCILKAIFTNKKHWKIEKRNSKWIFCITVRAFFSC